MERAVCYSVPVYKLYRTILPLSVENKGLDERERQLLAQANTVGLALLAVFLVLFLIELFVKGGKSYDLLAMLSGFLSVSSFCRYYYIRKQLLLLTGASGCSAQWCGSPCISGKAEPKPSYQTTGP